eukprot:TRINITY_DN1452_c0_g1_i1.p1 TRINITY_DN1452_c0_g1~~TRINITY_DN1452_c0_g1_i1.p1  ORF type:complete len:140 (-),score=28.31 TRINITY_DN1452_c0_g1_i1:95-514(-)
MNTPESKERKPISGVKVVRKHGKSYMITEKNPNRLPTPQEKAPTSTYRSEFKKFSTCTSHDKPLEPYNPTAARNSIPPKDGKKRSRYDTSFKLEDKSFNPRFQFTTTSRQTFQAPTNIVGQDNPAILQNNLNFSRSIRR